MVQEKCCLKLQVVPMVALDRPAPMVLAVVVSPEGRRRVSSIHQCVVSEYSSSHVYK
jgi:hypothetical protein